MHTIKHIAKKFIETLPKTLHTTNFQKVAEKTLQKNIKPFHYKKKSTISDFRQNSTMTLSLLRDFKSANFFAISLFVSKI